ncbi:DUF6745 domain-containing protein [Nocardia veterana]|uniref:DUF6745 domain-containing protein n=1 Tax=Nocardia veterana TaxID=132249 RepID=A0A7X6RIK3_9NOCA|nr:hypothetical protein [Nocardia veterana]NKY86738.1 hypothetical protein [Nocardia veterana]
MGDGAVQRVSRFVPGDLADWRSVATAVGPADRSAAEDGVRTAYTEAGLPEPERIVWVESPRAAVTAVRALADPGASVRERIRTAPWAAERQRVVDAVGADGWSAHWLATGAPLWKPVRALVDRLREAVVESSVTVDREERSARIVAEREVRGVLLDAVLGQHDAPWLAAFDDAESRLTGLAAVARQAGWWWPYERVTVIAERPLRLCRDEAGRLHSDDGPAVAFIDGFALHAWRGMPVPAGFFTELGALTPERIRAEENAELRRVLLEHYGYDRYLTESGAEPVHRDDAGILWRIPLSDDEDVVMVEVVNSTPEPDGTHRTYWLRVPPSTTTATAGVAWTFGLSESEYRPLQQT